MLAAASLSWLERRPSDRMVAGSNARNGNCVVVSLGKTLNANFLTSSLCGVEDSTGFCFTTAYTRKKIFLKKSGHDTAGISESRSG